MEFDEQCFRDKLIKFILVFINSILESELRSGSMVAAGLKWKQLEFAMFGLESF